MLDIAGALLLALGLMFKPPEKTIDEATPRYDFNVALEANAAAQSADAQVGAVLLSSGFAAQLASTLGARGAGWGEAAFAIGVAGSIDLVAVGFLLKVWRPWHVRRLLAARLASLTDLGTWWPALAGYGDLLGKPPPSDIGVHLTIAEYGEQLLGVRWRRLVTGLALPAPMIKLRRELPGTTEYIAAHGTAPPGATVEPHDEPRRG